MIRKLIGLLLALGMIGGSGYILYMQAFHSSVIKGEWLYGAAIFGFLGLAWLWADYIGPLLGFKHEDHDA